MKITEKKLRKIIKEAMTPNVPDVMGAIGHGKFQKTLKDLEYQHDQLMGFLDGQAGIASRGDIELAGEEIVDLRDQMAKVRAEQGLPEKDYSSNSRHKAERVVQGEIKFRKRGY